MPSREPLPPTLRVTCQKPYSPIKLTNVLYNLSRIHKVLAYNNTKPHRRQWGTTQRHIGAFNFRDTRNWILRLCSYAALFAPLRQASTGLIPPPPGKLMPRNRGSIFSWFIGKPIKLTVFQLSRAAVMHGASTPRVFLAKNLFLDRFNCATCNCTVNCGFWCKASSI